MRQTLQKESSNKVWWQLLSAIPISVGVFVILLAGAFLIFEFAFSSRIFPGVYVDQVNLSGLTVEEAQTRLAESLPYTYNGRLQIVYGENIWEARPIDLGYVIDPAASAQAAFDVGRDDWLAPNLATQVRAWFGGVQLSPVGVYDEKISQAFLAGIAAEINRPVVEANLGLEGTEVVVKDGQVGRQVKISETLALLTVPMANMQSGVVSLVVEETPPAIMDASAQAEMARQILSQPLILTLPGGANDAGPWTIEPEDLAAMLTIARTEESEAVNPTYQVALNRQLFGIYLNSLAPTLYVDPVNARFIFNDETGQLDVLQPAVIGRELDVQASLDHINTQLAAGEHTVALQFQDLTPVVTDDMTGAELGITELVHQETSYFYGSNAARIQNIKTASAQFHGLLIPPDATFSMAQALGNVSLENGYAEALIIYGDQTIQGVGGGVCQVSTTLFRTAFFAGFPIEERHAHAYRVRYYEMESNGSYNSQLAGLDATVYVPIVDLKFTNDTDYWLLMETYIYNNSSLTWKFYSTSDGRSVEWTTTGLTNVVPAPDPLYTENPDLPKGVIEQVDYAADGAEITINRTVYRNGAVYFADSFYTRFQAWQAKYEYGPGTDIPDSD
jgi:vancomycin resistance protein YoaR